MASGSLLLALAIILCAIVHVQAGERLPRLPAYLPAYRSLPLPPPPQKLNPTFHTTAGGRKLNQAWWQECPYAVDNLNCVYADYSTPTFTYEMSSTAKLSLLTLGGMRKDVNIDLLSILPFSDMIRL